VDATSSRGRRRCGSQRRESGVVLRARPGKARRDLAGVSNNTCRRCACVPEEPFRYRGDRRAAGRTKSGSSADEILGAHAPSRGTGATLRDGRQRHEPSSRLRSSIGYRWRFYGVARRTRKSALGPLFAEDGDWGGASRAAQLPSMRANNRGHGGEPIRSWRCPEEGLRETRRLPDFCAPRVRRCEAPRASTIGPDLSHRSTWWRIS